MATDAPLVAARYRLDAPEPDVGLFETWRATDLEREATVRLERLPPPTAVDFSARLRALKSLSDVGLAPVLDGGLTDSGAFVVTERNDEQRSLAHWLAGHRTAGTLPSLAAAQRLFDRVGATVRFVHEARLPIAAHGALCARNVLVRRLGAQHAVRLLGLGTLHASSAAAASAAWELLAPYLCPAQGFGAPASAANDLFALAVLQAEILTARASASATETWGEAAQGGVARVRSLVRESRDDVPDGVVEALTRALAPSPRERFATAALLTRALRDAWTAAGRWSPPGAREAEPPTPDERSLRGATTGRARRESTAPQGWQEPERAPAAPAPDPSPAIDEPRPKTMRLDAMESAFLAVGDAVAGDETRLRSQAELTAPTAEEPVAIAPPTAEEPAAEAPEEADDDAPIEVGSRTVLAPTSLDADDEEDATHALLRSDDLFARELAKSGAPVRPALAAPKRSPPDVPREAPAVAPDAPAEVSLTDRFSPSDLHAVRASLQPPSTRVTEPPTTTPPPAARSVSPPRRESPMPWRPTVVASVVGIAVILAAAAAWVSLFVVHR